MKRFFGQIFTSLVLLAAGVAVVAGFTSCENFLKAQEVKQQVEDAIAYNNAKPYLIKVTSVEGTGTVSKPAAGEALKKVTDSFEIRFEPLTDYEFLFWEVSSTSLPEGASINDYIQIEDPQKTETTVTLKKSLENIIINATVIDRPRVISYSPMTSGVLKDSPIMVLFNKDMDSSSIYYSDPEITKLKTQGCTPLSTTVGGITKYYGYTKVVNGAVETFFKNISIVNNKTNENLAEYFNPPVFESSRALSIAANKDKLLDDYTQVLVVLEKNFFYSQKITDDKQKSVTMPGSELWMYQVNNRTDNDSLVLQKKNGIDLFTLKLENTESESELSSANAHPTIANDGTGISTLKFLKIKNQKPTLYCDIALQDVTGGSGPNSTFTVNYERVIEDDYLTAGNGNNATGSFTREYTAATSQDAIIKGDLDLDLPCDGVYRIWFDFTDRSKNHFYYPDGADEENSTIGFYVAKDTTPTSEVTQAKIKNGSSDTDFIVSWEIPQNLDYKETVVTVTGAAESTTTVQKGTKEATISGIEGGKIYEIKVSCVDYAGTKSEGVSIGSFLTGLNVEGTPTFSFLDGLFKTEETASSRGLSATAFYSDGSSKIVSGNAKVAYPQNIKKEAGFSYTEGGITKIGLLAGEYYIAKNDVLHINLSAGTTTGSSATFGNYPQSSSGLSGEDAYTSEYIYKEWYLGKDGYFYAKNGDNYYKVEPVHWRVLESKRTAPYRQEYLLLASSIMESGIPYYVNRTSRNISSETIETVNYYYSTVRAFLRGEYQSGDTQERTYEGKGFLQIAFTEAEREKIWEITLLKRKDFINSDYGFNTDDKAQEQNRSFAGTAWACSKGLKEYSDSSHWTYWTGKHYAWTQPDSSNGSINILGPNGSFGKTYYNSSGSSFSYYSEYVDATNIGILPAIRVYGNAAY